MYNLAKLLAVFP